MNNQSKSIIIKVAALVSVLFLLAVLGIHLGWFKKSNGNSTNPGSPKITGVDFNSSSELEGTSIHTGIEFAIGLEAAASCTPTPITITYAAPSDAGKDSNGSPLTITNYYPYFADVDKAAPQTIDMTSLNANYNKYTGMSNVKSSSGTSLTTDNLTTLEYNKKYYISIYAQNSKGLIGPPSDSVSITAGAPNPCTAPSDDPPGTPTVNAVKWGSS